jgi:hypothetical protein
MSFQINSCQFMPFMSIYAIHVNSCHSCQFMPFRSFFIGLFRNFSKVGGGREGGQISLPRPSATVLLSGQRQKCFSSSRSIWHLQKSVFRTFAKMFFALSQKIISWREKEKKWIFLAQLLGGCAPGCGGRRPTSRTRQPASCRRRAKSCRMWFTSLTEVRSLPSLERPSWLPVS